jgi:hypothetical protein
MSGGWKFNVDKQEWEARPPSSDAAANLPGFSLDPSSVQSPYYWGDGFMSDMPGTKQAGSNDLDNCWHNWKKYEGFNESYWFCENCDKKKTE